MTNDEFKSLYHDALRHGWVTSKDPTKAAEQKKKEKAYNAEYYQNVTKAKLLQTVADSGSNSNENLGDRDYKYARNVIQNNIRDGRGYIDSQGNNLAVSMYYMLNSLDRLATGEGFINKLIALNLKSRSEIESSSETMDDWISMHEYKNLL